MAKDITMETIAKELGVSKSLVSRALSDSYGVSDKTRNEIKLAAIRMGYVIKTQKRKSEKTDNITVVVEKQALEDADFWVKIINALHSRLNNKGKSMFLSSIENNEIDIPISISQMKSDGIIVLGRVSVNVIISSNKFLKPIVLVDSMYEDLKYDQVMANNYRGAYNACEYLLKNGHKRIGFVGSENYSVSFKERIRGFTTCMNEHANDGIEIFMISENYDDYYIPFNRDRFIQMMKNKNRPTALVCANDITAIEVYSIFKEMGIKIPKDISIIGFDNITKSEWLNPPLTTVHISKSAMGNKAADLIMEKIDNPTKESETILIGTHIIARESVKSYENN